MEVVTPVTYPPNGLEAGVNSTFSSVAYVCDEYRRSNIVSEREKMWLSPDDVAELTARKRWGAQRLALRRIGITFIVNAVGRPLVEKGVVSTRRANVSRRAAEPHW